MTGRVLVLGDSSSSALTVVRSLGRRGLAVVAGVHDPRSVVPHSRFVSAVIRFPSPTLEPDPWKQRLKDALHNQEFDLVIPATESTLIPIALHRSEFDALATFAMPDDRGFVCTFYKQHTLALATVLGVPAPRTAIITTAEDLAKIETQADMNFPLVVKPASSKVLSAGRQHELRPVVARDWSTVVRAARAFLPLTPVLIQTYVHGIGVGQEFLAHDGAVLAAFQHERVHEPTSGGQSSYRKSVHLDDRLLAHSRRLLAHLRWTGVAMVEYKYDPATGRFALMEINGRFWGSLPLAVAAGVDFPAHLYDLLVEGRPPTARRPYRVGLFSRNIVQDLSWFKANWTADRSDPSVIAVPRGQPFRELINFLRGRECLDTLTLDDPRPAIVEAWDFAGGLVRRAAQALGTAVRRRIELAGLVRRARRAALRRRVQRRPSILFLCRGNICRSPFAEAYARATLSGVLTRPLTFSSAGTDDRERRPPPELARAAARPFGVSLEAHRSRSISGALIHSVGVVLCMDLADYRELTSRFPHAGAKLFFLGPLHSRAANFEIADPWGKSSEEFRRCYERIAASIDELARILPQR